jgi:hypothetical protein
MSFDHEKFKNVAAGLQSVVTLLGICIGGVWILYTFWALGAGQKAKAACLANCFASNAHLADV